MKKGFYMFLVTLLLAGCGGAGTTTSGIPSGGSGGGIGGDGSGGGTIPSGPVGYITVSFPANGPAPSAPVSDNVELLNNWNSLLSNKEHGFRITVGKYELVTRVIGPPLEENEPPITVTDNVRTYFKANSAPIPGTITIAVPVDTGYLIEVVTYDNVTNPSIPQLIRYAYMADVAVVEGANSFSPPIMVIDNNSIALTRSGNITGNEPYSMTVTFNTRVPLRNKFNFADNTSNTFFIPEADIDNAARTYTTGVPFSRNAPPNTGPTATDNIYFQGQFYLSDSMLSDAEIAAKKWKYFRLNAPNYYNDPIMQRLYRPGEVSLVFPPI